MESKTETRTRRLDRGLYEITIAGQVFELESADRFSEGQTSSGWHLFAIKADESVESGHVYCNTYGTKRDALESLLEAAAQGAL